MKKLLILILIGLLLTLSIFIVMNGLQIGSIEILGINGIQDRSSQLDEKIQEASKLAEKDYKQAVSTVQDSTKKLKQEKQTYDDLIAVNGEGEGAVTSQIERYEIETLWVILGNHATSEGAIMKMDVVKGSTNTAETYNLKFTVNGSYISITDFISDIENDSKLGFKIEEFKMVPASSGTELEATFVCKDISIKDVTATSNTQSQESPQAGNTNATNTNNSNTSTNNTNNTSANTNTSNNTNATNTQNVAR